MIIVDSKELSKNKIIEELIPQKDLIVKSLTVGDYIIQGKEKNVIIERKTFNDFINSVPTHLWEQIKNLASVENHDKYFILELGNIFNSKGNRLVSFKTYFLHNSNRELMFYDCLLGIQNWGIKLIITKDLFGTLIFIKNLYKKLGEERKIKEIPFRKGFKKGLSLEEKKLMLLQIFGNKTAKTLLEKYKIISRIPNDIEEIKNLKLINSNRRIGEKKAKEIVEVFFS
jgi:ERCC4-type nuclease